MDQNFKDKASRELQKQGLRMAGSDEPGWYVLIDVDGVPVKVWGTDELGDLPDDYEKCSDCGFDHEYEPAQAQAWHRMHGAPSVGIGPHDSESERERKLRGESVVIKGSLKDLMEAEKILTDDMEEEAEECGMDEYAAGEGSEIMDDALPYAHEADMEEVAPPGWEGTVKAMKKHKNIKNPSALANYMKNKGDHSHIKEELAYDTMDAAEDVKSMETLCKVLGQSLKMGNLDSAKVSLDRIARYVWVLKQGIDRGKS